MWSEKTSLVGDLKEAQEEATWMPTEAFSRLEVVVCLLYGGDSAGGTGDKETWWELPSER